MLKQAVKSEGEFDNEFFDYLRCAINELCDEPAEKFGLYTPRGEPRGALHTRHAYEVTKNKIRVVKRNF